MLIDMVTKPHQLDKANEVTMNFMQDDGNSEEKVLCMYVASAIYVCLIATITQDAIANTSSKGKVN